MIWGDDINGKSTTIYTLTSAKGQQTRLEVSDGLSRQLGGMRQYIGKQVMVRGSWIPSPNFAGSPASAKSQAARILRVEAVKLAIPSQSKAPAAKQSSTPKGVSGSHPWVTLMCKLSDKPEEPKDKAYFEEMYSDSKPGLNHYWKDVSFDTFDVSGSAVAGTGWYTLPHDDAYYNPTATEKGTDLAKLRDDCIAVADADVDFSSYDGINMMFNFDVDRGWAWGSPAVFLTLDGVTTSWSVTWEPPWGYADISVIAHEMGHGFGLPHSTAIDWSWTYDNAWDVMSQDRYNCSSGSGYLDPTYGCVPQNTISHSKKLLDVIPASKILTLIPGTSVTVDLDDLAAPTSTGYHMVRIPISTSPFSFYTVEARRHTGYDAKLPGEAVIIHKVEGDSALLMPSASSTDPSVMWTVGETFSDAANGIEAKVNATTAAGFNLSFSYRPISEPVDTVMALDRSGSMLWSVPGENPEGYPTRREALSAGVSRFLSNLLALSPPADSTLGLTLFSSKALDVPAFPILRTPVDAALATEVSGEIGPAAPAHSAAPGCDLSTSPDNCEWRTTSIGAALQDGLAKLAGGLVSHGKSLVLFTDGEQNTAPFVTSDGKKICPASSDPAACVAEPEISPDVRIISVGIGDPSSTYHTLLQNLAKESRFGTYISANTTTPDDFPCSGSLSEAFQCVASYTLAGNSPQMVSYSSGTLTDPPQALNSFALNAGVKMLLLSITFDQAIDPVTLQDLTGWIVINKDSVDVTKSFQIVGDNGPANQVLLKASFPGAAKGKASSFQPQGTYQVTLSKPSGLSGNLAYKALSIVDDESLTMSWAVEEPSNPRADEAFLPSIRLAWLGMPLDNATVTARVLRPGDDLGDVLAKMPDVDPKRSLAGGESATAGQLKYLSLLNDRQLVQKIVPTSGEQPMPYRGSGTYDTSYNPNLVSGVYQIRYDVEADAGAYGKVQRVAVQSVYVRPGQLSLDTSVIGRTLRDKVLRVTLRPKTSSGKLIGPGQLSAFTIKSRDGEQVNVREVGQGGTYEVVLTGDLDQTINVDYLGQPLYVGKASDFGRPTYWRWLLYLLIAVLILLILWWIWRTIAAKP
jgi:M6 family metalloprotease-like protein